MAIITAAAMKTQAAAIAAAVTIMLRDDTVDFTALPLQNPHHPLRKWLKMINIDYATGLATADDDYIDEAYAGNFPTKSEGTDKIGETPPITVVSATLETAAPNDIVITFSVNVQGQSLTSIAGAAAAGKTITSITVYENVMTVTTDVAFIAADVVTVSSTIAGINLNALVLTDQAVTNNIV